MTKSLIPFALLLLLSPLTSSHITIESPHTTLTSTANPVQGVSNAISGYLSVNDTNTNSKLFYIFYQCRNSAAGEAGTNVPLIIWLQGGPGDGSELSAFYEMGPNTLTYDQTSGKYSEGTRAVSWTDNYNMLFIDSPRGSGYSIADQDSFVTSEVQVVEDLLNALKNFYGLSQFAAYSNTPLYIFGSGYAGHYIPSFARSILQSNAEGQSLQIPLAGVGIGNGLVDPINQLSTNGLFGFSLGLIDDVQRETIEQVQINAADSILTGNYSDARNDFDHVINLITSCGGGVNVYNYRNFGSYNFSGLTAFFNDPDTVTRYNVDPSVAGKYGDNSVNISESLRNETMKTIIDDLVYVVGQVPVLIYAGQDDVLYNAMGVQNWLANFEWTGQDAFYASQFNLWVYQNGSIAGLQKSSGQLTFAIVNKAGHYASMDQIESTSEMVKRFVNKQDDWSQPL